MNLTRRTLIAALAVSFAAPGAFAAEPTPFDAAAFRAAQNAGRPVLVHVTAPWCGTCQVQKPIVEKIANSPDFKDLAVFNVDFDTQKEALKTFGVRSQSTMVMFKGPTEIGRSVGDTKAPSIEALLRAAL